MHAPLWIALGHLLMENTAAGGHPLHVTSGHGPSVPEAVVVVDGTGEYVGDRLDAAMGMPREAGEVVVRVFVAEVVEQ